MVVSIEQHVEWVADLMVRMREQGQTTVEPLPEAEVSWGAHVEVIFQMSLHTQADTWYTGANVPGKPRLFTVYIGGVHAYRNICEEIAAESYPGFAFDGSGTACTVDFEGHVMRLMPAELQAA